MDIASLGIAATGLRVDLDISLSDSLPAAANSAVGLGNPESKAHGAVRRFFVPALWRAVRGSPSGLPGLLAPVYQPAYGSPPSRLVTTAANS